MVSEGSHVCYRIPDRFSANFSIFVSIHQTICCRAARARAFQWFQDHKKPLPAMLQTLSAKNLILFAYNKYRLGDAVEEQRLLATGWRIARPPGR